jgi:tetratricopeptide (TPR) repeat protein
METMDDMQQPVEDGQPEFQKAEGDTEEAERIGGHGEGFQPMDFLGFDMNIPRAELIETVEAWSALIQRIEPEAERSPRAAALVIRTRLRVGVAYCVLEDWQAAIDALELVRKAQGADPVIVQVATGMLSAAYSGLGDYDKTLAFWNEALEEFEAGEASNKKGEQFPGVTGLYLFRAQIEAEREQYAEAVADCEKALRYHPAWGEVFSVRGLCRAHLGDLEGALSDCDRSVELEADSARCYRRRGVVRRKRGEFGEALADFDRALELDPDDRLAQTGRSEALLGLVLFMRWPESPIDGISDVDGGTELTEDVTAREEQVDDAAARGEQSAPVVEPVN